MASNVEPLLEPGMALDRLAAWQSDIDRIVSRTRAMRERLDALRVTASDPRRLVEVTIDTHGALLDIRFGTAAQRSGPDALGRTVMAAVREARRRAVGLSRSIVAETVGTESVAAREMISRLTDRLPGPGGTQP